jgi:hypothetical protein
MISLRKINNHTVKPIQLPSNLDKRPIRGYDLIEELYANVFLCARKKVGKTTVIYKIIKDCIIKSTVIYLFCSTIFKDEAWIEIRKKIEKNGNELHAFTSIYEDGQDQLDLLIEKLSQEAEEQEVNKEDELPEDKHEDIMERLKNLYSGAGHNSPKPEDEEQERTKPRKSKYRAPEVLIVFDDISNELKSPTLLKLLKMNRHFRTKIVVSSQYPNDLLPQSRKMIDVFMIFKGFSEKKMKEIYRDTDSSLPFDIFYSIYKKATSDKKHSFLYIDTRSEKYRCNFDKEFIINEQELEK